MNCLNYSSQFSVLWMALPSFNSGVVSFFFLSLYFLEEKKNQRWAEDWEGFFLACLLHRFGNKEWGESQGRKSRILPSPQKSNAKQIVICSKHHHFPTSYSRLLQSPRSLSCACSSWQNNPLLSMCHFHTTTAINRDGTTTHAAQLSFIWSIG